eukprot:8349784-Prorocentrum_lima.AAC.1
MSGGSRRVEAEQPGPHGDEGVQILEADLERCTASSQKGHCSTLSGFARGIRGRSPIDEEPIQ